MIQSFRHKGLEKFYLTGSKAGINPSHANRLQEQLTALQRAFAPDDVDFDGWFLHPLKGELAGVWSIRISASWRLTFRFVTEGVELLDYQDYH